MNKSHPYGYGLLVSQKISAYSCFILVTTTLQHLKGEENHFHSLTDPAMFRKSALHVVVVCKNLIQIEFWGVFRPDGNALQDFDS